jgi:ATP-dependent Lon protease
VKLQKEISKQVEEKVSKQQREYFLREQLKNIKKVSSITYGIWHMAYDREKKDFMYHNNRHNYTN